MGSKRCVLGRDMAECGVKTYLGMDMEECGTVELGTARAAQNGTNVMPVIEVIH
ncbi:hypothetical protein CHS0354_012464 [Potamilus streckersoni]|uniref:Uncharacterized protein n=1 Tax=Potamilus streckersoni TaxID=2493646 RepID=A0AAE0VLZ7_9BIVA|nr:hypothetical protein CHS0354_012464 [Potamilus streckersoni]